MSDPYTYYNNWAKNVEYQTREFQRNLKPIEPHEYKCDICDTEYTSVLLTGHLCYYCGKTYGKCCKGRYGTCKVCWGPLSASEKSTQKKRYQKIVAKNALPAGIVLPFILFGILGGILLVKFGTAVGLPVLLVGEFGSVALLAIVLIRRTTDIEAQRERRKKQRVQLKIKNMKPYEKFAIYTLFGLLAVIIIAPIIILLSL